jgi:hypothetical protein
MSKHLLEINGWLPVEDPLGERNVRSSSLGVVLHRGMVHYLTPPSHHVPVIKKILALIVTVYKSR